jgi:putative protein kinase ArgK-like GTPase of G3E family
MRGSWFDTIIIETVGVSQSESSTTWSIFLFAENCCAGDELQIKRESWKWQMQL